MVGDIVEIEDDVWAILEERDSGLLKVEHCETRERRVAWKTENSISFNVPSVQSAGGVLPFSTVAENWQDGLSANAKTSADQSLRSIPMAVWP